MHSGIVRQRAEPCKRRLPDTLRTPLPADAVQTGRRLSGRELPCSFGCWQVTTPAAPLHSALMPSHMRGAPTCLLSRVPSLTTLFGRCCNSLMLLE
jgi:hypothetical protein